MFCTAYNSVHYSRTQQLTQPPPGTFLDIVYTKCLGRAKLLGFAVVKLPWSFFRDVTPRHLVIDVRRFDRASCHFQGSYVH
jgi:hypothetical protein